jgi:hypothetical protein
METINSATSIRIPWNKGKLVGQKAPFKLKKIWAIRVRLQIASRCRELALFNWRWTASSAPAICATLSPPYGRFGVAAERRSHVSMR